MKKLVVFGFGGKVAEEVLERLEVDTKVLMPSNTSLIRKKVREILQGNPSFFLGLGEYFGKDQDKLRIETECSNKFRNCLLGERLEIKYISDFLPVLSSFKRTTGIGNSYCNFVSYLFAKALDDSDKVSQFGFIHIPKKYNTPKAVIAINELIYQLDKK